MTTRTKVLARIDFEGILLGGEPTVVGYSDSVVGLYKVFDNIEDYNEALDDQKSGKNDTLVTQVLGVGLEGYY